MSNVVEIPHIIKSRNFILLKNTTLTNNKQNCSAEAAAASIISSSTKICRSADLNEFSITSNTKRLILPNRSRLAPKSSPSENGKNTTTFIFLPVSLSLTGSEKQLEESKLVQSTAKMDDLADAFKFKSATAASSLQSYQNGGDSGGGNNGFYANNGHFDETCLKNDSLSNLALKRHSIVVGNRPATTKKLRLSSGGPSSSKSSYSAPSTPKNFNNFSSSDEHISSLDDNASSTSKNYCEARAVLADRLKNSQKHRKKFQPKEETINEGICLKPNGLYSNEQEISLDKKGDIFIDLTGSTSNLSITAPATQNGDYFSFSELPTSNNDRRSSYPVTATFPNSLVPGDNLLNDNELILLTPPTTSTHTAGPSGLFFEHNDLVHRPPPSPFEIGYQQQLTFNQHSSETTHPSGSLELCPIIPPNLSNNENVLSTVAPSFNRLQQNNEYATTNAHLYETQKDQEVRNLSQIQFDAVCRPDLDMADALSFPPSTSAAYMVHSSDLTPNGQTSPIGSQIVHQLQHSTSEVTAEQTLTPTGQIVGVSTTATVVPNIATLKTPKQPSAMCGYVTLEKDGRTQTPCRQRCINGFKFCIRHILNDSSAPYKPCAHVRVTGTKSVPCNNAVLQQANVNSKYCGTHLIMMGLRTPKTRKTKNPATSIEQNVNDTVSSSLSTVVPTTTVTMTTDSTIKSTKKLANKSTKSQKSTQECPLVLSNGQNQLSGQSFISSNLPPISRSHSTRPSAEIMLASPVPSPSVSIPRPYSSSLLPSNANNNIGNGTVNVNPFPSPVNQSRQQIIRQIEQQDGKICYLISDINVPGLDPQAAIPSANKKFVDQSKVATVLTNQIPSASISTVNNQVTTPIGTQRAPNVVAVAVPPTKPKKVIRLKPKKRKLKMTGKYREIGFVNQMCRIVEDFDFDNSDLFPLGLEPSSSDSDSDDDSSLTGNMSLPKFDYDNFIVPQIADDVDNNYSVSSAFLSKAKRQLYLLKKNINMTCKDLRRSHIESKIVGSTARLFPNSCGQAFYDLKGSSNNRSNSKRLAQMKRYQAIKKPLCHVDLGVVPKKCAYRFGACDSKENKCQEKCLPYSIMCPKHILAHNEQTLFRNCTYRGSDDCPEPPCPMTALPAGLADDGSFRCYKHQIKDLHKNPANPETVNTGSVNNNVRDKKRSKKTTAKKPTRKRKKKPTVPIGPYSDHGMTVIRPLYTPDEEGGESADEHGNEEYSNQDAQAALASVAKDFGFANYDLTDMLVRMPDESLIDNILDQDFSKSSLTELQPLQNVAAVEPTPSTSSSLPQSSSAATGLNAAATLIGGSVMETFERLTTAVAAAGDHNWADIEQFLLEENIKASSSVSPNDNSDLTSPTTTTDFQTATTPLLLHNNNNLQYFDAKNSNNSQKREESRSLDCSSVQNIQLLR